jgi:hypothetical protein
MQTKPLDFWQIVQGVEATIWPIFAGRSDLSTFDSSEEIASLLFVVD